MLAARAPGLAEALEHAQASGAPYRILGGKVVQAARCKEKILSLTRMIRSYARLAAWGSASPAGVEVGLTVNASTDIQRSMVTGLVGCTLLFARLPAAQGAGQTAPEGDHRRSALQYGCKTDAPRCEAPCGKETLP